MPTARGGLAGLRTQVKPTFTLPAVGMALFGAALAPRLAPLPAALHALAVGSALLLAHLVDEYVDAHLRGEESPRVALGTLRPAVVAAAALGAALVGLLWAVGRGTAAALTAPLPVLAALHAPLLDRNPVAVTVDYPLGVALAVVGGYAAQRTPVPAAVAATAAVFLLVLSAAKLTVDRLDADFDRRVDKRTVPVLVGHRGAARGSAALVALAAAGVAALAAWGVYPPATLLAVPVLLGVAAAGLDGSAPRATRWQIRLTYPVALVLFLALCPATDCAVGRPVLALLGG